MTYRINPAVAAVHPPPITEVLGWLAGRKDRDQPLIDLCQAVPSYPPAPEMTAQMKELLNDPMIARYTPDEGLPEVREAVCARYRRIYGAEIDPAQISLTVGASQAFWLAMLGLCQPGDEVIVQEPAYFDHPMALAILGIKMVPAPFIPENAGIPDPATIAALITPKTRAMLIVTPSNPTGAVTPPEIIAELHEIASKHDIALVLDETYADFIAGSPRPHNLFTRPDWPDNFIQIMSFGKTYALTGFRAGMLAASAEFIRQVLKAQDTMTVCQPRISQLAVKYGTENLDDWVRDNCRMMQRRHDQFRDEFTKPGNRFELVTSGAFFAWVKHPFHDQTGRKVARKLVEEAGILTLPGEVFGPSLTSYLRLAFGNISDDIIPEAVARFRAITK
ncbi:aminotransferase [Geobacter pelophilus]|uniref:Aminotransferase n=1 Tax=Geoanaerobacter pelophilus TaxID=60036 RepID=A0AAW4L310_9BACT|nr:aminotransferase [Geoanaerobacter pelophilus]MBT0665524.1 aminotransferase [Geoanaerobacter pelophilus]